MAVHVEDCELELAIAVILQISGDTIRVKWLRASTHLHGNHGCCGKGREGELGGQYSKKSVFFMILA